MAKLTDIRGDERCFHPQRLGRDEQVERTYRCPTCFESKAKVPSDRCVLFV